METEIQKVNAVAIQIQQNHLSRDMAELLEKSFLPFYEQANEWMDKAQSIQVTDVSQTKEMKMARDARLALRDVRVAVEKKRKELKDESLRTGKAIDGVANVLKGLIEPIEAHLQAQEDFAAVQEQKRIAALQVERFSLVMPYVDEIMLATLDNLGAMPQSQFDAVLLGFKTSYENKIAEAKRIEDERIAKEKADAEERQRQKEENERLKAEADLREKAFAEERAKAKAEQDRLEAEAKKQREAAEKEASRIKNEAAVKLKAERDERERIERENQRLIDAENKRIADQKYAEEKLRKEQAAAEKKAARAPDKQKILAFADLIDGINVPDVKSQEALDILTSAEVVLSNLVKSLRKTANLL